MSWNESKRKKCLLIFLVADIVLLLAFIVTCLPFNKKTSSQSTRTALLNVNKVPDIARITLSKADGEGNVQSVVLSRVGSNAGSSFWTGRDTFTDTLWPADNQSVANLLNTCSQIVSVRTAAETVDAWSSFGLDEDCAFVLGFYDAAGGRISEILFGDSDYLTSRIAFRTSTGNKVLQMDVSIASYLTLSTSFWADPFVYPQAVTGYTRLDSESILRHGALLSFSRAGHSPEYTFKKDFENGASARFLIYKGESESENPYIVVPVFIPGDYLGAEEKKSVESFNYAYGMSQWTLEKFSEEVQQQW